MRRELSELMQRVKRTTEWDTTPCPGTVSNPLKRCGST